MSNALLYRNHAADCLLAAENCDNDSRRILVSMATAWCRSWARPGGAVGGPDAASFYGLHVRALRVSMEYAVGRLSSRGGRRLRRGHCSGYGVARLIEPSEASAGRRARGPSERRAGIDASPGYLPMGGQPMHKDNASRQGGFRGQICSIGDIGERHRMLVVRSISCDDSWQHHRRGKERNRWCWAA